MYVYTTINTQIFVCIQIYYHSCKSYLNTHISVCKHVSQKHVTHIIIVTHISVHTNKYKYSYKCTYKQIYLLI